MRRRQFFTVGFLSILTVFLNSCASPRFEREWDRSVADYQQHGSRTPVGPWMGSWKTKNDGHTGGLRCIVSEVEKNPAKLEFWYHATWGKGFAAPFKVRYPVKKREEGHYLIEGGGGLGIFGYFKHEAEITKNSFSATYSNRKGEVGAFDLHRP